MSVTDKEYKVYNADENNVLASFDTWEEAYYFSQEQPFDTDLTGMKPGDSIPGVEYEKVAVYGLTEDGTFYLKEGTEIADMVD